LAGWKTWRSPKDRAPSSNAADRGTRHFFLVGVNSPDAWQTEAAVTHRVRPSTVKSQKGEDVPL
jgi:hypothetical protein